MQSARKLRRSMSLPEVELWSLLRRSPGGIRFRRQHPIGPYVADFYCPAAKLVIEVDGKVHDFDPAAAHDEQRSKIYAGARARGYAHRRSRCASGCARDCGYTCPVMQCRPLHHSARL